MKKPLLTAFVASLVMFTLSGLYTGVIARGFIASHVDQALLRLPPNLAMTYLGYLFLAFVMSFTYTHFVKSVSRPAITGLKFGFFSAVFWLMPYSVVLFSVYNFPYSALPLDFGWALVEQGLGGLVIGVIYGKRQHV